VFTPVKILKAISFMVLALFILPASPATAGGSQGTQGAIIINPGGGLQSNGSDGIKIVINGLSPLSPFTGSDQLWFASTYQWCCGGTSPMLNVGGQLFGEAGAATGSTSWNSISLISSSGALETLSVGSGTSASSATGNATSLIRYVAIKNSLNYIVDRSISYVYPNNFYTENYTFTIPEGNTEAVKFYQGGDAAPGSSDSGTGFSVTSPTVAAYEVNTISGIYISYQQTLNGVPFDGLFAGSYSQPYSTIRAGGDIGFVTNNSFHDAGLDMQWTIGSAPGTFQRSMITQAGFQSTQVTASFSALTVEEGQNANFIIQIVNTDFQAKNNLAFNTNLPSGLTISGSSTSNCGGTLDAISGASLISISGAQVGSGSNCTISIPVAGLVGTYSWSDQNFTVTNPLEKGFSTSTLTVTASPTPSPTATPSPSATLPATGANTDNSAYSLYGFALLLALSGVVIMGIAKRTNLKSSK